MSLELTIILGLQGSSFDGEVRPKLGTSRDDKSMRVEERSQSALGRNLRMEVREYLGRVGFRLSFKMKVTWPHLKVERSNPQMGNTKGEGIIYWLRCTWTCLKLEGAGSSKEGRQDQIAQHGGRIRGGPLFCLSVEGSQTLVGFLLITQWQSWNLSGYIPASLRT